MTDTSIFPPHCRREARKMAEYRAAAEQLPPDALPPECFKAVHARSAPVDYSKVLSAVMTNGEIREMWKKGELCPLSRMSFLLPKRLPSVTDVFPAVGAGVLIHCVHDGVAYISEGKVIIRMDKVTNKTLLRTAENSRKSVEALREKVEELISSTAVRKTKAVAIQAPNGNADAALVYMDGSDPRVAFDLVKFRWILRNVKDLSSLYLVDFAGYESLLFVNSDGDMHAMLMPFRLSKRMLRPNKRSK